MTPGKVSLCPASPGWRWGCSLRGSAQWASAPPRPRLKSPNGRVLEAQGSILGGRGPSLWRGQKICFLSSISLGGTPAGSCPTPGSLNPFSHALQPSFAKGIVQATLTCRRGLRVLPDLESAGRAHQAVTPGPVSPEPAARPEAPRRRCERGRAAPQQMCQTPICGWGNRGCWRCPHDRDTQSGKRLPTPAAPPPRLQARRSWGAPQDQLRSRPPASPDPAASPTPDNAPTSARFCPGRGHRIPGFFVARRSPSFRIPPLLLPSPLRHQAERWRPDAGLLGGPGRRGGRGCCGRSPPPPGFAFLTPGPCARAPGLGLAPRVRPAGSGRAGGADRGSLAAACAPRGQAERAEQNGASGPAPGGNKRGRRWGGRRRAGPGAAGVGTRARELAVLGPRRRAANGRAGGKRSGTSLSASSCELVGVRDAPTPLLALDTYWFFSRVW